ncbi:hypothetical protein N7516_006206 [Penicillium verrucosum]|uniref:uncharacterized protein n=1 Tax=Penicillium verrucosum TaxID=60171 RepID=UPI0025456BCB|nr:uncharacterized protein N7516_006206 [Penicillium verrucosum]KAJ5931717.1 hypothetical protein N7516_006206 [Penicillium verrucosum]
MSVKASKAWKRYMEVDLDDLELPPIEQNVNIQDLVYYNEAYCRADGCRVRTKFTLFANLKTHYKNKHPKVFSNFAFSSIGWFEEVIAAYDRRMAARALAAIKPPVPTKTVKGVVLTLRGFARVLPEGDPAFNWRSLTLIEVDSNDVPGIVAAGKQANNNLPRASWDDQPGPSHGQPLALAQPERQKRDEFTKEKCLVTPNAS